MDGRKIIREYTNPIDNVLIDINDAMAPFFKQFSFITPNVFTSISLIVSLIAIYYIYKRYYRIGGVLFFIGYFFDCMDGHYARKYNMVSKFGDLYDHISDVSKFVILVIVIINSKIKNRTKKLFIVLLVVTTLLSSIFFGCQEQLYNEESVLTNLTFLCPKKEHIVWARHFGPGFSITLISLYVFLIKEINAKL